MNGHGQHKRNKGRNVKTEVWIPKRDLNNRM